MVLAPDDVGDPHRDVVHDIHEMEDRLAVRTHDHEILLLRPLDPSPDGVLDHLGLPGDPEKEGAVLLVGPSRGLQALQELGVDRRPLALAIRPKLPAGLGSLIPVEAEPGEILEDRRLELWPAAAEDAPRVAGVEPVEQRRSRTPDVEKAGRAGGKADADL